MSADSELDFTSLLEELMAANREAEAREWGVGPSPSLQVDLLDQIERLQAENVGLFADRAMREYGDNAPPDTPKKASIETPAHLEPALEDLFFLDPESISRELGIQAKSRPDELDKARRVFAMRYHPDRVPEEYRERAVLRMQIANMLIDEAKRKKR